MYAADVLESPLTVQLLSRADAAAARGAHRAVSSPTSYRSPAGPLTLRSASDLRSRDSPTEVQEQCLEAASPGIGQPVPPQPQATQSPLAPATRIREKKAHFHRCRPAPRLGPVA